MSLILLPCPRYLAYCYLAGVYQLVRLGTYLSGKSGSVHPPPWTLPPGWRSGAFTAVWSMQIPGEKHLPPLVPPLGGCLFF